MITITQTDCIEGMRSLETGSIYVIFDDPPYFLGKTKPTAFTPTISKKMKAQAWEDFHAEWDAQWDSWQDYEDWTARWLAEAKRVLAPKGSIFICGSYHNIPRVGVVLQDQGWYVNRWISWFKPNAFPRRQMDMLTASTEIVIWARPSKKITSIYNTDIALDYGMGKNLRDMWAIPFDSARAKRLNRMGIKHPSKKPPALVERCIRLAAPKTNARILDMFAGSGTTGEVVAKYAHLGWTCTLFDNHPVYIEQLHKLFALPQQVPLENV